ncbi:hypothetical protein VP191E371_P0042 [Vibrio phage 191E37-1]|nr:hypothetical protein VP191E371_P0042 [Vibrio phage 191E37-1]
MSDFMLHGILNAPCEFNDPVAVSQLRTAAKRASKHIERLEVDKKLLIQSANEANKGLREENEKLRFMINNGLGWDDLKGGSISDVS